MTTGETMHTVAFKPLKRDHQVPMNTPAKKSQPKTLEQLTMGHSLSVASCRANVIERSLHSRHN
eukprot:scaffold80584_cov69-Phaeocystis_antarctica.AAC.2